MPRRLKPLWADLRATIAGRSETPFKLSRWFGLVALLSVASLTIVSATLLSRFVSSALIQQDAVLSMEFVQSVVLAERSEQLFERPYDAHRAELESMFNHVASMPDVLRANIYAADRTILWSSTPSLIGKTYGSNPDLDEALEGEVTAESGVIGADSNDKPERATMAEGTFYFVESYLPMRIHDGKRVAGVVEIYKTPRRLFATIHAMQRWIWIGAALSGLFLYIALFWMVRRADNLIRHQQEQLVQNETLAAMGEMGTAVAHGIRNPLAAMRSSAELALESDPQSMREAAKDIIDEADRLETWVSSLLSYARPADGSVRETDLATLAQACVAGFVREGERRGIAIRSGISGRVPALSADPQLLGQVLNSLISNALEATPPPTRIDLLVKGESRLVRIQVVDDGSGMTPRQLAGAFRPFFTTKPKGLGIGLPLAKRIVERFGGRIAIDSAEGRGTTVTLEFAVRE